MKINIEIDVPPEELRRFFGLPDLEPLQQEMIARVREQMERSADPKYYADLAARLIAGGAQSIDTFQKTFFEMLTSGERKSSRTTSED